MQLDLEDFEIIGIAVRTTNQNHQAEKDIGALWERFYAEDSKSKIPDKISEDVYCVYTEYETNHLGAFTTILGCQVKPHTPPPPGFLHKTILKSTYHILISEGPLPDSVQTTWRVIWTSDLNRRFTADFDVYGLHSRNPTNPIVKTFISIY